jgi:hypothetical protein
LRVRHFPVVYGHAEPQRTNLLLQSEEFENAVWTAANLSVTANSTTAPDGTIAADTLGAIPARGLQPEAGGICSAGGFSGYGH